MRDNLHSFVLDSLLLENIIVLEGIIHAYYKQEYIVTEVNYCNCINYTRVKLTHIKYMPPFRKHVSTVKPF